MNEALPWLILFLPFLAAAGITVFTLPKRELSAKLSISAVVVSFILSVIVFGVYQGAPQPVELTANWLSVGDLHIEFGLRLDPLSLLMLLVVTGVGGAIHIYSYGYMHEDRSLGRYFASLSLFTFSMLGIVLANNFVQMFIFWELVGLSSYLLIGFWYERPSAADAAKKAFITNRLGDFGFILGIILVWATLGSLNFGELQKNLAANPQALGALATSAGLLIFCGAMGKSAQFPLHVWLPDAMEGPTPVSALIHAATMVAAGVYMLCRVFFLLNAPALLVIAWIGGFTALLAALIAVQQNDIKRILAYSTLSQLGYMVMAVGLSAPQQGPTAAMFHLTTHAFFKALLFLGAGAVIISLHHEQNIWRMGGLRSKMPATYWTFLVAALALCGVPPFSGFYSKDEILALAAERSPLLFVLAVAVAVLTTFYMFRLIRVAFLGTAKSEAAGHAREAASVMKWPLVALSIPTVLSGLWGIDTFLDRQFHPGEIASAGGWLEKMFAPIRHSPLAALSGLGAFLFAYSAARALYQNAGTDPLPEKLGALARAMRSRFYFDEIYRWLIAATHELLSHLADWFDRWIIAGLGVRGLHGTTELAGRALRLVQTGSLQTYAFLIVLGVVIVMFFVLK
jgi:NADH-quinone oxidoreductase subunit L